MIINFEKGNFVVYENKTEKDKEEVETVKYFSNHQQAREHMSRRLLEEMYEIETICGYNPDDVKYYEVLGDAIKDCGGIIKETKTGKIIFELSLFISPAANFNPYEIKI